MADSTTIRARITARRYEIARRRRSARKQHGPDKANWPLETLQRIQNLIASCRADDALLRKLADGDFAEGQAA